MSVIEKKMRRKDKIKAYDGLQSQSIQKREEWQDEKLQKGKMAIGKTADDPIWHGDSKESTMKQDARLQSWAQGLFRLG